MSASVRIEIVQGSAQDFTLAVPPGLVVNQVSGATVADWQAADGTLRVRLLEPVSSEATFVVQARNALAARRNDLRFPSCVRPTRSARAAAWQLTCSVQERSPTARREVSNRADPSELGDVIAGRESPSMIGFRLRPLDWHRSSRA